MTRLDDIEDAARFRFECASTDGGKQLYGDILALVAVARAAAVWKQALDAANEDPSAESIISLEAAEQALAAALTPLCVTAPRQGNTRHE
ncbi:MAG: hypothetical protein IPO08_24790 [Xanthomonadales bacterium]|nr:hypothetical protein [Xanthomonadales bacterium]